MVCDFLEVFHVDLHGMSLDQDIDFTIDLEMGSHLISILAYQMTPIELRKLKV